MINAYFEVSRLNAEGKTCENSKFENGQIKMAAMAVILIFSKPKPYFIVDIHLVNIYPQFGADMMISFGEEEFGVKPFWKLKMAATVAILDFEKWKCYFFVAIPMRNILTNFQYDILIGFGEEALFVKS